MAGKIRRYHTYELAPCALPNNHLIAPKVVACLPRTNVKTSSPHILFEYVVAENFLKENTDPINQIVNKLMPITF